MSNRTMRLLTNPALCAAAALLSAAALLPAPARAADAPKLVKKFPMEFPGEAVRRGVDRGVLKAKVTIDGAGAPTEITILDANPPKARILNDSVTEALGTWRWEGQGKPTSFELQVVLTAF